MNRLQNIASDAQNMFSHVEAKTEEYRSSIQNITSEINKVDSILKGFGVNAGGKLNGAVGKMNGLVDTGTVKLKSISNEINRTKNEQISILKNKKAALMAKLDKTRAKMESSIQQYKNDIQTWVNNANNNVIQSKAKEAATKVESLLSGAGVPQGIIDAAKETAMEEASNAVEQGKSALQEKVDSIKQDVPETTTKIKNKKDGIQQGIREQIPSI